MKPDPIQELPESTERANSLSEVLVQSERVKELVEECAQDLSSVNARIKRELKTNASLPGVENALKKSESVEGKMVEASASLSEVNIGLTGQVRDRNLLDDQFAAVVEQEEAARHMALHDVLTDLPNRALLKNRLKHGLAHAKRHGWSIAVMFVDLDKFKKINDTYGHDVGDRVLKEIALRLTRNTRSEDTVSRYGGDEFVFLLKEIQDEAHVAAIARKIFQTIQAPYDVRVGDITVRLSIMASIGIALFPKDGDTAEMLVRKADFAMYCAKQDQCGHAFAT
jgi:diguanylate cyclase (GGDEF)-like protein